VPATVALSELEVRTIRQPTAATVLPFSRNSWLLNRLRLSPSLDPCYRGYHNGFRSQPILAKEIHIPDTQKQRERNESLDMAFNGLRTVLSEGADFDGASMDENVSYVS